MGKKAKKTTALADDEADVFEKNDNGQVKNTPRNIRAALHNLKVEVSYDVLADRILLNGGMIVRDAVLDNLFIDIVDEFGFEPKERLWGRTVAHLAEQNSFHPVRDYLDALTWDGEERIGNWLPLYLGAADNEYTRAVGRIWMIAAVRRARVTEKPVKFDEMLVLEGEQGTDKSTAIRVLVGEDGWFSDDLPFNADSKVFLEKCTGKWVIEFSELSGIRKAQVEAVKATLSRDTDRARLAYARIATEVPRRCVFAGTTNDAEYLRDMTGGRRFWPVQTGVIDIESLARDRDQLWAEAAQMEARGDSIRLDSKLWAAAAVEQESRRAPHPWEEELAVILELEEVKAGRPCKVRSADVWTFVGVDVGRRTQEQNVDLGKVMRKLGWERGRASFGGKTVIAYTKRGGGGNMVTVKLFTTEAGGSWRASTPVDGTEDQDEIPF